MKGRRCNHGKGVCGPDPEGIEDPGAGTGEDPGTGEAGSRGSGVSGAGGRIGDTEAAKRGIRIVG